jgi:hypothetical protein
MSLLEDEIKPTPRNYILGLLADAAQRANETVSRPAGYDNPPGRMLMSLLGVPAIAQTLDRLSYGEPLTTGRGMTTKVRPEAMEAAMAIAPGVGPATKATAKAAKAAAKELGPKAADIAERYMMEQGLAKPMIVWHGSPHKFEKFDALKIGTGEGAQAYGHGLYVAESPGVAKSYADALATIPDPKIVLDPSLSSAASKYAENALRSFGFDSSKAAQALSKNKPLLSSAESKAASSEAISALKHGRARAVWERDYPEGNLYKINLPDEAIARMLDWDKPLSQQTRIKAALDAIKKEIALPRMQEAEGAGFAYQTLANAVGGPNNASALLRQQGIPGIRYLDQASRGVGQGTSNFVIFPREEELLRILERNGIPIESLL